MTDSLFEQMKDVLAEKFDVRRDQITLDSLLERDLALDSLYMVELMMEMEERYGVEISDEEAERIRTVGDAMACLRAKGVEAARAK